MIGDENENTVFDSHDNSSSGDAGEIVSTSVPGDDVSQAPQVVEPEPEPVAPVQVVSVDELVDRLTSAAPESVDGEGEPQEPLTETDIGEEESPVYIPEDFYTSIANNLYGFRTETGRYLTEIKTTFNHGLETPFESYTTIEILLTILVLLKVVELCGKMIRRGFSWLLP